jgi:hydrogenase maturation protease
MTSSPGDERILVAGLGNLLLRDDGVGVHAVRALQQNPPPGAIAVEVGTAVLDALHLLERADKVLAIDAMQAGCEPGTVYRCGVSDIGEEKQRASLHEVSLLSVLRFLPSDRRPEITILGVEPGAIDYGLELSREVEAALPQVVELAKDIVERWMAEATPASVRRASR